MIMMMLIIINIMMREAQFYGDSRPNPKVGSMDKILHHRRVWGGYRPPRSSPLGPRFSGPGGNSPGLRPRVRSYILLSVVLLGCVVLLIVVLIAWFDWA